MANSHHTNRTDKPSRIDRFRRQDETGFRNGRKIVKKATSRREIIRRLASDKACQLMEFHRARTTEGKRSIMGWSSQQMTAGLRYIAVLCYGMLEDVDRDILKQERFWVSNHSDCSALTAFQIEALREIFMITCASESRDDRALDGEFDVILPGMQLEWYTDGIGRVTDLVDENGGSLNKSVFSWMQNVHAAELKREKLAVKARYAEAEAMKAAEESTESTAEDTEADTADGPTDDEITAAFAKVTPEQITATSS